ncbi:MAG: hypothetical protein LBU65_11290 [Planctomycetaceae bacterium]|nr:hypothetical protein [Planctomycetaceae bacterium]
MKNRNKHGSTGRVTNNAEICKSDFSVYYFATIRGHSKINREDRELCNRNSKRLLIMGHQTYRVTLVVKKQRKSLPLRGKILCQHLLSGNVSNTIFKRYLYDDRQKIPPSIAM